MKTCIRCGHEMKHTSFKLVHSQKRLTSGEVMRGIRISEIKTTYTMISYFQNEQGYYTITQNEEPITWVKTETQALALQREFQGYDDIIAVLKKQKKDLHDEILTLKHEASKAQQKHDNMKEVMAEMGKRFRAKLMSVYYLLGTIKKMGTHREKEVAVGYLQQTVDDLVNNDDRLSWDQDLFNIPF